MTHKKAVLTWWRTHKYISAMEGFTKLFIVDLAGVIRDLKESGYEIHSKWAYTVNIYGTEVRYKKYYKVK